MTKVCTKMEQNGFKYIFLFIAFRIKTKLYIFYKISVRHKFIGKTNVVENFNIDYIILNGKIIDIHRWNGKDENIMDVQKIKIEDVVEKINLLYKISKERELTKEEKELQESLRKRYIDNVKRNFRSQLEGIEPKK